MKNKNIKIFKVFLSLVLVFIFLSQEAFASDITEANLTQEINQQRALRGLPILKTVTDLNMAAELKGKDMLNRNYFDHYAFGLTPWDFMKISDYDYLYAGENLAMDFSTTEGMVNAWMNSPAHRDNILNPNYTDMGIGIVKGTYTENNTTRNTNMVVNMFGRKKPGIIKLFDSIAKYIFGN